MSNLVGIYVLLNMVGGVVALVGGLIWLRRQEQARRQQS